MEPIQPIYRTQSFLEPRFSLVKNKQLQFAHLAGRIYPGEALNKGMSDLPTSAYPDFRICGSYYGSLRNWPCTAG